MTAMTLYGFFRSGTSHRLRIALNLKGLTYEQVVVNLRREEHLGAAYTAINPQQLLPALDVGGRILTQSMAILEWLEDLYPEPALLPANPWQRARIRALAGIIACDIHPLNNRRVLERLRQQFGADQATINQWCDTWIGPGFTAFEALLPRDGESGPFAVGALSLADVCLIPQMDSARRFGVDLSRWPRLCEIDAACARLEAFQRAAPAAQADAV